MLLRLISIGQHTVVLTYERVEFQPTAGALKEGTVKAEGQPELHESSDEDLAFHGDSDDEGREEQARLRVEMCRMQQTILERLRVRPEDLRIIDPARHSPHPPLPDIHPHTRKELREDSTRSYDIGNAQPLIAKEEVRPGAF